MSAKHDIIVIGASAGGVEALSSLVEGFSSDLAASIFVVLHISPMESFLPEILTSKGPLQASHPKDFQEIERGHIYVAPPNHHLILEPGRMRIIRGPKENYHRPAIDCLFRSAAITYGPRVIGVVLSGSRSDDGIVGLLAVKAMKGIAIVQDPDEAVWNAMPLNTLKKIDVNFCQKVRDISKLLIELSQTPAPLKMRKVPAVLDLENKMAKMEIASLNNIEQIGTSTRFNCPECQGPIWEIQEGQLSRFRCHTGHAFSRNTLLVKLSESLEEDLWTVHRALKEKADLLKINQASMTHIDECLKHAEIVLDILAGQKIGKQRIK
jgi:two-component system, chemotaxis family, protein-glutamate methylesterase/glutaminase